jgi:hypothetical protein
MRASWLAQNSKNTDRDTVPSSALAEASAAAERGVVVVVAAAAVGAGASGMDTSD